MNHTEPQVSKEQREYNFCAQSCTCILRLGKTFVKFQSISISSFRDKVEETDRQTNIENYYHDIDDLKFNVKRNIDIVYSP